MASCPESVPTKSVKNSPRLFTANILWSTKGQWPTALAQRQEDPAVARQRLSCIKGRGPARGPATDDGAAARGWAASWQSHLTKRREARHPFDQLPFDRSEKGAQQPASRRTSGPSPRIETFGQLQGSVAWPLVYCCLKT